MNITINKKRAAVVALPYFCWVALTSTACGGDDDTADQSTAGTGGATAGSGGKNSGGSAGKNASGSGGSATAGADGGGTDTGGTSTAGAAANGGEPAALAGAAGQDPGVGNAGAGGQEPGGAGAGGQASVGGEGGSGGDGSVGEAVPYLFDISPTGHDRFYCSTFDAAGNLYAAGQIASSNEASPDFASVVAKFTPEGKLDPTFGNKGVFVRNLGVGANGNSGELLRSIVVQSTGKILAYGTVEHGGAGDARDRDAVLIRLNADGSKDTGFGTDGVLKLDFSLGTVTPAAAYVADSGWGLAKYPGNDDRLVISGGKVRTGGTDTNFVIGRLSADGVPDETFGTHGFVDLDLAVTGVDHNNASPRNVTILPGTDGIVGGGYQPKPGADTSPVVWKVTDLGVIDTTFGDNGAFTTALLDHQTESYSAVVQPKVGGGYNLVTTGYGRELSTDTTDLVSLRLTSAGVLDTTYGDDGIVQIDIGGFADNSRNLLVLPDRRIVLVGGGRLTSADVDGAVAVLLPDGAPDTTWGPDGYRLYNLGGPADFLWGVALSPDQKTLGITGFKGVGGTPVPAYAGDDTTVFWLPVP